MTNNTNVFARAATVLSVLAAVFGGLFIAPVAHADIGYGSPLVYTVGDQVCAGRYDPNCLLKENNYLVTSSLNYQQPYYNPSTYNTRYAPVPYVYNTPTYVAPRTTTYVPYVAPVTTYIAPTYSYQYQYSYSYPQTYSYSYPSYSYSYNTPTYYSSYDTSSYDDCEYSYDCDY